MTTTVAHGAHGAYARRSMLEHGPWTITVGLAENPHDYYTLYVHSAYLVIIMGISKYSVFFSLPRPAAS